MSVVLNGPARRGDSPVASVKDLVARMIAEYEKGLASKQPNFMIRIVTSYGAPKKGWTNTQYFSIGPREIEQLRRVRTSLR